MLKITRKFDYAMVLLTDLGLHRATPSSARKIAERYGLSPSLTANVLKELQRSSLVRSTRGVRGGYVLGREPAEISLSTIILAIDGDRSLTHCGFAEKSEKEEDRCPALRVCPVRGYVGLLERRIRSLFDDATLAEVIAAAPAVDSPRRSGSPRPAGGPAASRPRGAAPAPR